MRPQLLQQHFFEVGQRLELFRGNEATFDDGARVLENGIYSEKEAQIGGDCLVVDTSILIECFSEVIEDIKQRMVKCRLLDLTAYHLVPDIQIADSLSLVEHLLSDQRQVVAGGLGKEHPNVFDVPVLPVVPVSVDSTLQEVIVLQQILGTLSHFLWLCY